MPSLHGLVAAPFTAFRPNGSLALDVIPVQARLLAANGVVGAFVCGTTGEGASLTSEERRQVVASWAAARSSALKLIVHVGHLSLGESQSLARHAQESGADAIAAVSPSFFRPSTAADLVAWCAEVAAAAPHLPFYYYHMPGMTGVKISVAEFLHACGARIPTLAGVKFTHDDLVDFQAARQFANGRYDVLFGRDEVLLSALRVGAKGAVGSTYNYAAPLYRGIMAAAAAGDFATAERGQASARAFIDVLNRYGGLPAGKVAMKLIGVDCGPVRLPLRSLNPAEEAGMRAEFEALGFSSFACKLAA